jgi:hypothetical protein
VYCWLTGSGAFANSGDVVGVTPEAGDEPAHPFESCTLIAEEVVALVSGSSEFIGGQESRHIQAIATSSASRLSKIASSPHFMPTPMIGTPLSAANLTSLAWS